MYLLKICFKWNNCQMKQINIWFGRCVTAFWQLKTNMTTHLVWHIIFKPGPARRADPGPGRPGAGTGLG